MSEPENQKTPAKRFLPLFFGDWRRKQFLTLTAVLGVLGSFWLFNLVQARDRERLQSEFQKIAGDRATAIQRSVDSCMGLLQSMSDLYSASENVESNEFHIFARRALARAPEIQSMEWLPRIKQEQRAEFEKRNFRGGRRGWVSIIQISTNGRPARAEVREEYFPSYLHEGERRRLFGLDHYYFPDRQIAMNQARDTGEPTVTSWYRLPQFGTQEGDTHAVIIYMPIYSNNVVTTTLESRRTNLAGFAMGMAPISRLVRMALRTLPSEEIQITMIEQTTGDHERPVLHFVGNTNRFANQTLEQARGELVMQPFWEGMVLLANQSWILMISPSPAYLLAKRSYISWVVLLAGLAFTFFWFKYQKTIMERAAYVEQLVDQRTAQLQDEITVRRRVEDELARERDLFHTLLDNLPDRIYFKDIKSRFLRVNKAMANLFNLQHPREAYGKSDFDFFTDQHAKPAFDDEQEIIKTGQPLIGRVEFETLPDGKTSWALTTKMPLRDNHGQIVGTFGISRDISTLKTMEERLAEERNLLRNLIEHLPDYIYVKDVEGSFLIANPTYLKLVCAASTEEIVGKKAIDVYPPSVAKANHEEDRRIIETGQPLINHEEPAKSRGGKELWFLVTKVPLRDTRNRCIGLVCVGRDITTRRQMEDQLKQANADLQKSHEELKSAQMQLIEAEKMQSVGRLAAGVAHEVKNPLAILGMGIDYLSSAADKQDPNVNAIIDDMRSAIQRADGIILGLLDFSAPRDMMITVEDINHIIEQSLTLTKHEQVGTLVTVQRELKAGLPKVELDTNKIMQVFVNLFMNAFQAMDGGGVLTVRSYLHTLQPGEVEVDAGNRLATRFRTGEPVVVVEVDDTGPGISEDKLERIFDPFFTTKPTGQGTGLGLTVTRKIVEMHGGTVTIKNRMEGGARATLLFKALGG